MKINGAALWDAAADHLFSAFGLVILLQSATAGRHLNK